MSEKKNKAVLEDLVGSVKTGYIETQGMDEETKARYMMQKRLLSYLEDARGNRKLEDIMNVEKVANGHVHVTFKIEADGIFEEVDSEED